MSRIRLRYGLLSKLATANITIILGVATGGVWLARHVSVNAFALMAALGLAGAAISSWACHAIMKNHFRPLQEFRKAVDAIHAGLSPSIVAPANSDPAIGGVIRSLRDAFDRLEDESLWHTAQLLNSIEAERRRIGRELHDQTSQSLATALINLKLADNSAGVNIADSRGKLAAAKRLIEHSLEQIKICVYDLRPVMLDDLGLVPTLRWHIKTHLGGTGIAVATDFDDAAARAPRDIETTLYRVAQEALANVLRHAQAARAFLRLEVKPEYAVLTISDNGKGFDVQKEASGDRGSSGGLGLHTIRERVKLAKGTLNIVSEKGLGTEIHVVIPFPKQNSLEDQQKQP